MSVTDESVATAVNPSLSSLVIISASGIAAAAPCGVEGLRRLKRRIVDRRPDHVHLSDLALLQRGRLVLGGVSLRRLLRLARRRRWRSRLVRRRRCGRRIGVGRRRIGGRHRAEIVACDLGLLLDAAGERDVALGLARLRSWRSSFSTKWASLR